MDMEFIESVMTKTTLNLCTLLPLYIRARGLACDGILHVKTFLRLHILLKESVVYVYVYGLANWNIGAH